MHAQRSLVLLVVGVGILGICLPWMKSSHVETPIFTLSPARWQAMGVSSVPLVAVLLGQLRNPLRLVPRIIAAAGGLGMAGFGIWKLNGFHEIIDKIRGDGEIGREVARSFSIGKGPYILIAAGFLIALLAALPFSKRDDAP